MGVEAVFFTSYCQENNAKKLYVTNEIGQPQMLRSDEIEEGRERFNERRFNMLRSYYYDKTGIDF